MSTPLGNLLDDARLARGPSLGDLAARVDMDASSISRILAGKQMPRAPALRRFARVLHLDAAQILDAAERSRPSTNGRTP